MSKRISQRKMVLQTIGRSQENWLCCQFCISRPHPFLATADFVVNVHMKMRVVENFGQLSNVMYKNMGLLTWETRCKNPIWSTMLRIST